jgi:ferredoxin
MRVVACSSRDPGKQVREVCKVGCIGCGGCARRAEDFKVNQNLSVIDYDQYDPETMDDAMQLALEKCPMKTIVTVGIPEKEDLESVRDQDLPELIKDEFKTTVDDTTWHG